MELVELIELDVKYMLTTNSMNSMNPSLYCFIVMCLHKFSAILSAHCNCSSSDARELLDP